MRAVEVGVFAGEGFHVLGDVDEKLLDLDRVEALPFARELALLNLERAASVGAWKPPDQTADPRGAR